MAKSALAGIARSALCIGLLWLQVAAADTRVFAGISPGLQGIENGQETGPAVELLKVLFAEAQLPYQFEISNWAQAHKRFAATPESLMFSVARYPAREKDFLWVCDIGPLYMRIGKRKDRTDLNPTSFQQLKSHKLAVVRSSAPHFLLLDAGFIEQRDFGTVSDVLELIKFIDSGIVDFIFYENSMTPLMLQHLGYPRDLILPTQLELPVHPKLWLVASKDFPPSTLRRLQLAHQQLLQQPQYQKLRQAVLPLSHR